MLDTTDMLIKTIDFLMEEIKNIRREKDDEKDDLIARIKVLEHENMILKQETIN